MQPNRPNDPRLARAAPRHEAEEEPLDPAAERVRRRLVRLLMISFGTLFLGFVAVFGAIVYKLGLFGGPQEQPQAPSAAPSPPLPVGGPTSALMPVPEGARILSTAIDGSRILLHLQGRDGDEELLVVDAASGTIVNRLTLVRVP
ncbi:hypothetical protein [Afifella pfennigii]|uniref:hypothetical protein n=1 Tax=Afifella pfennigii TaxID=209897 RepID=UPI00068BC472|nr:hypothetical protein [Afifella pfennigii]